MSSRDSHQTVGYPVHQLTRYREWTNPHGVNFTDWQATCGAEGVQSVARWAAFGQVRDARRGELCRDCWPGGHPLQRR